MNPPPPTTTTAQQDPINEKLDRILNDLKAQGRILAEVQETQNRFQETQNRFQETQNRFQETQDRILEDLSVLTEMSVRQSVGVPVPPEYRATLIKNFSSLLAHLNYLKARSCPISALAWPFTMLEVEDRVLHGLADPVGVPV